LPDGEEEDVIVDAMNHFEVVLVAIVAIMAFAVSSLLVNDCKLVSINDSLLN